jgi:chromosome segregation ATPase
MQSLRRLKDRKRAIAQQTTVTVSTSVDVKLKAQGLDIANLKKERDDIKNELLEIKKAREEERNDVIRQMKAYSTRLNGLMDKPETLRSVTAAVKPLADQLHTLQRAVADLPGLQKGLQDLKTVPTRLAAVEDQQSRSDALGTLQLKPLSDKLNGLEAASSQHEQAISGLRKANELQNTDILTLKTWKDAQPKPVSEEAVRKLIADETTAKTTVLTRSLGNKIDDMNRQLSERITSNQTSILIIQTFMQNLERQKLSDRLTTLSETIKEVEANGTRTYNKADRLEKRVDTLEKEVEPGSVDGLRSTLKKLAERMDKYRHDMDGSHHEIENLQKYIGTISENLTLSQRVTNLQETVSQAELGRLPIRLSELEKSARTSEKLSTRVDEVEKAAQGPNFKRVGTTVASSSSAPITPPTSNAEPEIRLVKDSLQDLRKFVVGTGGLESTQKIILDRVNNMEVTLKTVEETAEKKIKALLATDRKSVDRNIQEVDARLTEEIQDLRKLADPRLTEEFQALQNRIRELGVSVSSAVASAAPPAQSEVSNNDIGKEIDDLYSSIEAANERIGDNKVTISALQDSLPNLFKEHFDPFKAKVEEQLDSLTTGMHAQGRDLASLAQQVSNSPSQVSQQNNFGYQQEAQLNTMAAELTSMKEGLTTLRSSLSTKAESEVMNKELEAFNFVLRNMESRYENISTDTLYQGMVRWFAQMYPGLSQLQEDINQLRDWIAARSNTFDRLSQDAAQLRSLVNIAPPLHELANISPQLNQLVADAARLQSVINTHNEMPATLARIDQASFDAKTANTKADQVDQQLIEQLKTIENLKGSVSGLQNSLRNLNSATSPFVRAEALSALQATIKTLQTQLGEKRQEHLTGTGELEAVQALRSAFERDRGKRDTTEGDLQKSIKELAETAGTKADIEAVKRFMVRRLSEEHDAREEGDKSLRSAVLTDAGKIATLEKDTKEVSDKLKRLMSEYESTTPKIWEQLGDVETAAAELRKDFDTTVQTYIEPNRDFFSLIGTALVAISQLQQVVESLNQNLPVAPLKLEWDYYLPTHGQSEANGEPSNPKRKGKSKQ